MDFKKLFRKDEKAVSPVIGVILMVAITVILAAAIGSSVFSKGTAEAAPQASLNMKADGTYSNTEKQAVVRIEHLGGDALNLTSTKLMIAIDKGSSTPAIVENNVTGGNNILDVGDTKAFKINKTDGDIIKVISGNIVNIKIIDVQTNQLICDKNVRF